MDTSNLYYGDDFGYMEELPPTPEELEWNNRSKKQDTLDELFGETYNAGLNFD